MTDNLEDISIRDYLKRRGIPVKRKGRLYWCSSPFSKDSTWSFAIYPNNSFYDFANNLGGNIFELVKELEGVDFKGAIDHLKENTYHKFTPKKEYKMPEFVLSKYLTIDRFEKREIDRYARERGIRSGYLHGFFQRQEEDGKWNKHLSLVFPHKNLDLEIVGAKFRVIDPDIEEEKRFSARGRLMFYVLETKIENNIKPILYLVESETSANSLWEYLKETKVNAVVLSCGSVSNIPLEFPHKYSGITDRKLIIDYDGNEELYKKRTEEYEHLRVEPIKLELPKGEDINSLWVKNRLTTIK